MFKCSIEANVKTDQLEGTFHAMISFNVHLKYDTIHHMHAIYDTNCTVTTYHVCRQKSMRLHVTNLFSITFKYSTVFFSGF